MFQIVRCILAENGEVAARQPLQPLFDLWEDATAIAEFANRTGAEVVSARGAIPDR